MNFPEFISLTLTNACNLRCRMCGQWSETGYMHQKKDCLKQELRISDWIRVVDEIRGHRVGTVLLRGGEVFLLPWIGELLEYLRHKELFISIDTNGTALKDYLRILARMGEKLHLTFSVDGPEEIHDQVRGIKGAFGRMKENIRQLLELERELGTKSSKSACFTISPYSYRGLGQLPEVIRSLGIESLSIVPYYYFSETVGRQYEKVMREELGCEAFSWAGFHHETSGIDWDVFRDEYRQFLNSLNGLQVFPYMGSGKEGFKEEDYRIWFAGCYSPVGSTACYNVERFLDIQPNGDANFCCDFPDYVIGNVREATIQEIWNSGRADRFREYRRQKSLPICWRCGAKYMSEIGEKV
ncbi:MAG: radical SAM protein [Firmicutes bacterium]|nr:radical SAM protein [Bacillota bacterium]